MDIWTDLTTEKIIFNWNKTKDFLGFFCNEINREIKRPVFFLCFGVLMSRIAGQDGLLLGVSTFNKDRGIKVPRQRWNRYLDPNPILL